MEWIYEWIASGYLTNILLAVLAYSTAYIANKIVLEKIKKQYEVRVDNAIETGCDDDVLEGYREDYEFVRRLLDVQELLESSRVKYSQQHYYWEVYIKGEKVA